MGPYLGGGRPSQRAAILLALKDATVFIKQLHLAALRPTAHSCLIHLNSSPVVCESVQEALERTAGSCPPGFCSCDSSVQLLHYSEPAAKVAVLLTPQITGFAGHMAVLFTLPVITLHGK